MASNKLPDKLELLFALGHDMLDGAAGHGAQIGLTQHTAVTLGAVLADADAEAKQLAYDTAAKTSSDNYTAQRVADSNGKAFIGTARDALKPLLGKQYNPAWTATGFPDGSLAIPGSLDQRKTLLNALNLYFKANPSQEISVPNRIEATAAAAKKFYDALTTASTAIKDGLKDEQTKKIARDTAVDDALRGEMSGMIAEIGLKLDALDPGWLWFGLNKPGATGGADVAADLTVTAIAGGFVAHWSHAANAALYHLQILIVGTDADFRNVKTTAETEATLTGLPAGATVKIRIVSVNDNGTEAKAGDEVQVVIG